MKNYFTFIIFAILFPILSEGQPQVLDIGIEFPELRLTDVQNFNKKELRVNDFRGNWLVVDFWSPHCGTCIGSFPKLKEVQDHFDSKLKMILVSDQNSEPAKKAFKVFSIKADVVLPIGFNSEIYRMIEVPWVPFYVIIDPDGIIRAKLDYQDFTVENIQKVINGQEMVSDLATSTVDAFKPMLVDGNGGEGDDFLYRSLLMKWKKGIPASGVTHINAHYGNLIQMLGVSLKRLYFAAYQDTLHPYPVNYFSNIKSSYGKYWLEPVLELADTSSFIWSPGLEKNLFCYSLSVPPSRTSSIELQRMVQRDLKNYFGYEVSVEKRMMPCWKLVANEKAKNLLAVKDDPIIYEDNNFVGFKIQNLPMSEIITKLWWSFQTEPQFVDATGITQNISIKLEADMSDFEQVKKELSKKGLDLVRGQCLFETIVIRDKEPLNN
ncbi:MAG: TlpA disulfide reductase family protein [Cyclobacteriaceae bacterium]|jgi:thiol-disulfide isomerase/thioredoxin